MAIKNRKRILFIVLPIIILSVSATAWYLTRPKSNALVSGETYQYVTIQKGNIQSVVTSTGILAPVSEVSVLSQMSGTVEKVNVHYNDQVKRGEVLAELNTNTLKLQQLQQEAAVSKAQATYNLQLTDYQNKHQLAAKGLLAAYDLASSKTALDVDAADLRSVQAALKVIQLQIDQYAKLTSPIDGIVLDMNIQVGQSVVDGSSSNATSLFMLAEDLNTMEIEATVNELDISSIKAGQKVTFTVDANPGTTYSGTVKEIHLVPVTSDSVVNYYVIINANNPNGTLLPGMTANIRFIKEDKTNVLVVPNAALRFTPPTLSAAAIAKAQYLASLGPLTADEKAKAEVAYVAQQKATVVPKTTAQNAGLTSIIGGSGFGGRGRPGSVHQPSSSAASKPGATAAAMTTKYLWYMDANGKIAALKVTTGSTDGTNTEITGVEVMAGKSVILKIKVEA